MAEGGDKTEQPTPKKLRDARQKGQVCTSRDIVSTAILVVLFAVLGWMGVALCEDIERLLGFIGGVYAREWDELAPAERAARALSSFADLFGPRALDAIGYIDQRWGAEPWVGGGPTAAPGPGAVVPYAGALATPVGSILWAGTETADRWTGFMDGAVRAGERAALQARGILTSSSTAHEQTGVAR